MYSSASLSHPATEGRRRTALCTLLAFRGNWASSWISLALVVCRPQLLGGQLHRSLPNRYAGNIASVRRPSLLPESLLGVALCMVEISVMAPCAAPVLNVALVTGQNAANLSTLHSFPSPSVLHLQSSHPL